MSHNEIYQVKCLIKNIIFVRQLLFNIFIHDVFLFISNSYLSNYADGNTLYAFDYNLEETNNTLCFDFDLISKWFEENYLVTNADKWHFVCLIKIWKTKLLS